MGHPSGVHRPEPDSTMLVQARDLTTSLDKGHATVLFPVDPVQGETLLSYVMRTAEWNHLGRFGAALQALGFSCRYSRHTLCEVTRGLGEFRDALGVHPLALATLWGVEPLEAGRRRLGGVWLRPNHIAASRRRLPPSILAGQHDQAIWMVKHLGFCPSTWELLTEVCPRRWCGRPLWWWGAPSIDQCWHCGSRLNEVKRSTKVPVSDRPPLRWIVDLFDDREEVVERAINRVPPIFSISNATDLYELIVGFARIFQDLWRLPTQGAAKDTARAAAAAARFILEFPRSHWDFEQSEMGEVSDFRIRLRSLRDHSSIASVRENAGNVLDYGRDRARPNVPEVPTLRYLNLTNTARALQIEASAVNDLVAHKFLVALSAGGGRMRKHRSFRRTQVAALQSRMVGRLSWADFCRLTGLPQVAVEQLLAVGALRRCEDDAIRFLYGPGHLERIAATSYVEQLLRVALPEAPSGWISLRDVMTGVGGRAKPWAPMLNAALEGDIPGGVARSQGDRLDALAIHPLVARRMVMGGPEVSLPFGEPPSLTSDVATHMGAGGVADYLNCTAQDISWLRARGYLRSISIPPARALYLRSDVEALSVTYITTREIAARLGLKAKEVWEGFDFVANEATIGQGFHVRAAIETKFDQMP